MTTEQRAMLGDKEAQRQITERCDLLPCPLCGKESVVHMVESVPKYAEHKKEIPIDARLIRCMCYPSGKKYFEYREKEFVPQCVDSSCCGRAVKRYKTMNDAITAWNIRAPILTMEQINELEAMGHENNG